MVCIQDLRTWSNLTRISRLNYINDYIMKEREFIASFYNAQNTKSGETIFEMIMNIGSETI